MNYQHAISKLTPGQSEIINSVGNYTYVGVSKEGDIVLQEGDNITCMPELEFNLSDFKVKMEKKTFVFGMTEAGFKELSDESDLWPSVQFFPKGEGSYVATIHIEQV